MTGDRVYTFQIEIYTTGLFLSGSFDISLYRRLSDVLNSRLHRYITLHNATIAPLGRPQQVQPVSQLLVDWGNALLVTSLTEPTPPSDYQATPPLTRQTQPMMFFTTAFALRANFYQRPDWDLATTLEQLTDDFIPLNNVQIFPFLGGQPVWRQFACLSREHIQAMYVIGAPDSPAPAPSPPTSTAWPSPADMLNHESE